MVRIPQTACVMGGYIWRGNGFVTEVARVLRLKGWNAVNASTELATANFATITNNCVRWNCRR